MAEANATGWPDDAKNSILMNTLNDRLMEAFVSVSLSNEYNRRKNQILEINAYLEILKFRR